MSFGESWRRVKFFLGRGRLERELAEEMEQHVALKAAAKERAGMMGEEARQAAQREFGNMGSLRGRSREMWGLRWLEALLQDIRFGARILRRSPGFASVAVLTLALGIGASVAFFSVAESVLLHPVDLKGLERLVAVFSANMPPESNDSIAWWEQATSLPELEVSHSGWGTLRWSGHAQSVLATLATPQFFDVFEAQPAIGRSFLLTDQEPGAADVAVLSHQLWNEGFGASRGVVGQEIFLDGTPLEIVGVAPAGFHFPGRTDLWIAQQLGNGGFGSASQIMLGRDTSFGPPGGAGWLIGRLKPGATAAEAQAQMQTLNLRAQRIIHQEHPDWNKGAFFPPAKVVSLRRALSGMSGVHILDAGTPPGWSAVLLFGASLFLLLVACLHAGNLLLARSLAREREMAIRQCLGATRQRVAKQMLGECTALALAGGTLGVALAWWGVALLRHAGSAQIAGLANAHVQPLAVGFALLLVLLAGLVSGAAPALDARRVEPGRWLGGEGHILAPRLAPHARKAFAAGQVALAFVLIAGAAVTAETLWKLLQTDPGFDPNGVMALRLVPAQPPSPARQSTPKLSSAEAETAVSKLLPIERKAGVLPAAALERAAREPRLASSVALDRELYQRLRAVPGVESVGLVDELPFGGSQAGYQDIDARGRLSAAEAQIMTVEGDYFRTLKIPLLAGRFFANGGDNSRTVIVDRTLAQAIWGNENPIGKFLGVEGDGESREVIGVVGDVRFSSLARTSWELDLSQMYFPMDDPYRAMPARAIAVVVRTAGKPANLVSGIYGAVASVDPEAAVYGAATMGSLIGNSVGALRFRVGLLLFFALAAVVLGLLGVYGVVSFAASRRTREFALRIALGARPGEIVTLAVREAAVFVPVGIAIGVGLTFGLSALLASLLPGMTAPDAATTVATGLLLWLAALTAGLVPALRASRIHPSEALRYE